MLLVGGRTFSEAELYKRIDNATNGLGSVLEKSLAEVAEANKPAPEAPAEAPAETPAPEAAAETPAK